MPFDYSTQLSADFASLQSVISDLSSGQFISLVGYRRFSHPEYEEWKNSYGHWQSPEEGGFPDSFRRMIAVDRFISTFEEVINSAKQFAGIGEDSTEDRLAVSIVARILQILRVSLPIDILIQETFVDKGSDSSHEFVIAHEEYIDLLSVQCVLD